MQDQSNRNLRELENEEGNLRCLLLEQNEDGRWLLREWEDGEELEQTWEQTWRSCLDGLRGLHERTEHLENDGWELL